MQSPTRCVRLQRDACCAARYSRGSNACSAFVQCRVLTGKIARLRADILPFAGAY